MDNIDIYNNSAIILSKKTPSKIISWITILIIILILFIIISFIPFNVYNTYQGYIIKEKDNTYIDLLVNKNNFPINKSNKLYIKKNKYKYQIIDITNKSVLIKIDIKNGIEINNNIVNVIILKERTTIIKELKEKIKKGFEK